MESDADPDYEIQTTASNQSLFFILVEAFVFCDHLRFLVEEFRPVFAAEVRLLGINGSGSSFAHDR